MIDFIPLASSSAGCAYLLKSEGHQPILLDAGLSFTDLQKMLWSEDVNVSDLAGVLISHGHGDHAKAVPKLMAAGVDCYGSGPAWLHMLRPYIASEGRRPHRAVDLDIEAPTLVGPWVVIPFDAVHDGDGTVGFLIDEPDCEEGRLLYLTDSAYCPYRFEGLTHVCVEANFSEDILKENAMAGRVNMDVAKRTLQTHASIERVIEMLKANDLSKVEDIWLLHLSDSNSNAEDFRVQVQKATGCCTYVAPRRKQ